MRRRELLKNTGLAAVTAAAPKQVLAAAPADAASLDVMLRPRLAQHNLPALAAAALTEGKIVAAGAVGTRRACGGAGRGRAGFADPAVAIGGVVACGRHPFAGAPTPGPVTLTSAR